MAKKAELDDEAKKKGFKESYIETLTPKTRRKENPKRSYYYVNKRKKAGTSRSRIIPMSQVKKIGKTRLRLLKNRRTVERLW